MACSCLSEEWQTSNLSSRSRYLLRNAVWSDVEFEIGEERKVVKAHRLVLASASSVFAAKLYGTQAEGNSPVRIPDVTPEIFDIMLEFIYTESLLEPVRLENLPDIDYVSKKYLLPRLLEACVTDLVKHLNPVNVIRYYEMAAALEHQHLIDECTKVLSFQTREVFRTESFLHAKMETVEYIFSLNQLAIHFELDLLVVIQKYARANGIDYSPKNYDEIKSNNKLSIRPLLEKVRFLSSKPTALAEQHNELRTLLTETEILSLVINLNSTIIQPIPKGLSTNKRSRDMQAPFVLPIPGEVAEDRVFRVSGLVDDSGDIFYIDFYNQKVHPGNDDAIMLQLYVQFEEECCIRNSYYLSSWGRQEREGGMPFERGQPFEVVILTDKHKFLIYVNGDYFCEYRHRISYKQITHIMFCGNVTVLDVSFT